MCRGADRLFPVIRQMQGPGVSVRNIELWTVRLYSVIYILYLHMAVNSPPYAPFDYRDLWGGIVQSLSRTAASHSA